MPQDQEIGTRAADGDLHFLLRNYLARLRRVLGKVPDQNDLAACEDEPGLFRREPPKLQIDRASFPNAWRRAQPSP